MRSNCPSTRRKSNYRSGCCRVRLTPSWTLSLVAIGHVATNSQASQSTTLVDYLYTYGAPSVSMTHSDKCTPGIRTYTEDQSESSCQWWQQLWCTNSNDVTNTDFAAQINIAEGYTHPKVSTLVLKQIDGTLHYELIQCQDNNSNNSNNNDYYQSWPDPSLPSTMIPGLSVHKLTEFYEPRLLEVPAKVRGPLLEYTSVAQCNKESSEEDIVNCLSNYPQQTQSHLSGVSLALGYQLLAFMKHTSQFWGSTYDDDTIYILKRDRLDNNENFRSCIIGFECTDSVSDMADFMGSNNSPTSYCGIPSAIHSGVKTELWDITHNYQYATTIRPALETCQEVTCVGYSLGGALCNLFVMCANQGEEYLAKMEQDGQVESMELENMWDDYHSLIWTKPVTDGSRVSSDDYW